MKKRGTILCFCHKLSSKEINVEVLCVNSLLLKQPDDETGLAFLNELKDFHIVLGTI